MATPCEQKSVSEVLRRCSLFAGIPPVQYAGLLEWLHAVQRDYCRDSSILEIGDAMPLSGIVIRGSLEVSLLDEIGSQINVNHIGPGQGFGMAMACAGGACPIRLRAMTDCTVLFLNYTAILEPGEAVQPEQMRLASNLIRDLARQTVFLNRRLRIMGQKRLRDKIKVYLQNQPVQPDGTIRLPFNRSEMAEYLYADRSALSRELGRMQEEGILLLERKTVRLLDPDFLKGP